ncbi:hypothetical protein [uncultured Aquimarina sp.]|uniref:FKBP-type peptidyl-prolyl cis-trans isomerase n=1 Tax=uncultured Aquimarina sp. TaxID=575652 RepID=UPI00261E78A5|nr:hypothetical protein [uncultured Aquimarina sp.]
MNIRRYIFAIGVVVAGFYACSGDDDNGIESVPPRDRAEQQADEDPIIQSYLKTHFYTEVGVDLNNDNIPEYTVTKFDTIAGANSSETSIWDSGFLETKTITREDTATEQDVDYTIYVLNLNSGAATERQPTFADSTFVTYRGELFYDNQDEDGDGIPDEADVDADGDGQADSIDDEVRTDRDGDGIADDSDADDDDVPGTDSGKTDSDGDGIIDQKDPVDNNDLDRKVFDNAVTPLWFDQLALIEGWRESIVDFKGASNFIMPDPNGDGTATYNMDFGNFTVFFPSGLGYFSSSAPGGEVPLYSPLIFNIQLYGVNQSDHDNDGIPSYLEDIDGDRLVFDQDDDTDADTVPDYLDADDDNDGTLTRDEITVNDANGDGFIELDEITFYDDDGDGIKNHLDADDSDEKN